MATVTERAGGTDEIRAQLHQIAETSGAVLALWTPIMLTQPDAATHLGDFADLHRRAVRLLAFLKKEVDSGSPLGIAQREEVVEKLVTIIQMASRQDHDLFAAASDMAPER